MTVIVTTLSCPATVAISDYSCTIKIGIGFVTGLSAAGLSWLPRPPFPSLSLSPFSDELTGTVVTLRRPNPLDYPPHQPRMRRNKPAPLPSRFFRRGGERGERKSSETNDITTAQSENTGRLRVVGVLLTYLACGKVDQDACNVG